MRYVLNNGAYVDISYQFAGQLYNWDSYFISLGLLVDGYVEMARGMVEHFIFEIKHYGKILNGSRSYVSCYIRFFYIF